MDTNGNIKNIPEEILFDILTLLPVKSLCRFRCVSKYWFSIISDPDFITAHSSRSKSRPKLLFSVTITGFVFGDRMSFYSIEYPELEAQRSPAGRLHATAHGTIELTESSRFISTSALSASGLICCNSKQGIRIGNPITREFNFIHHYNVFLKHYLGFDPIEKRDFVLQLDWRQMAKNIRLFSLSESQWHDIPPPPPQPFFWPAESAICINGIIYFTARYSFDGICLNAFDVRLKCFEMIQCPHDLINNTPVIEYKGRVALVCYENEDDMSYNKLWILEDPKKHSWSCKSFAVSWPHHWRFSPKLCGTTHRGELMFVTKLSTKGSLKLFLFEIDTNTLRRFQVDGFGGLNRFDYRNVELKFLIESLHSPNKSN